MKECLAQKHGVIVAGRKSGDVNCNIADLQSVKPLFATIGMLEGVVCTGGEAKWAPFESMTVEDFHAAGLNSKLMGQVNLVLAGWKYIHDGGSFTFTSWILADDSVVMTTSAAMVN